MSGSQYEAVSGWSLATVRLDFKLISCMVTELIRAVNYFPGNICQPVSTGAPVDVDSLTVFGFMRKCG